MIAEEYLAGSLLFGRLKKGCHAQLIECYAARLVEGGLARRVILRSLRLIGDFMSWMARSRFRVADIDGPMVERFLRDRARKRPKYSGDRPALKRFLSVLRDAGVISPAEPPRITTQDQIFADFGDYLQRERGLAPTSIIRHLPAIRRFLCEVCPAGSKDLGKINHADVVRYVERHARDGSPSSGKLMCWSLRAFFRYLHHKGLNRIPLAGCVPSIRRRKFANLPTFLSAEQVQKVLNSCDRATAIGRRNYAIVMMLAKLGLRADEIVTLTLDDIDWRSGEMRLRAKGRQQVGMPIPPDVGAAVVAYLRDARALSLRVAVYFSARPLPTSALHFLAQSPRSLRPLSLMPAFAVSPTKGLISFGTASPPSFSGPMRHCRRSASCWDTRVTTQPASMPRWTSIRSGL
jgi:site-specific recombinase XerD